MEQSRMIFLDSWIWLEVFSKSGKWEKCKDIILSKTKKVISTIVIMEVKYRGMKKFGLKKTAEILYYIESDENIKIIPITTEIARAAADLRYKYHTKNREVSYGDMINLATALVTGCEVLYSGDDDFKAP
ncbi:PIN domain-containing protein [Candidatus Woesearchaeota archaeon]|nr:PIN domain-containing protein [Candidatus Woesearchaeota archaeon]